MAIIQAQVPVRHLATRVGNPNRLTVRYSTDVLLPVPGPLLIARLRRDFFRSLLLLNDVLLFAKNVTAFHRQGGKLNVQYREHFTSPRKGFQSPYRRIISASAKTELRICREASIRNRRSENESLNTRDILLTKLVNSNMIFHELYDAGVICATEEVFSDELLAAKDFDQKLIIVLTPLLANRRAYVPKELCPLLYDLADQALDEAKSIHTAFLNEDFGKLAAPARTALVQWMVSYHNSRLRPIPTPFRVAVEVLGTPINLIVHEWAFNRKEQLTLEFGIPDIRGPVGAEPIPPQGERTRENYITSRSELSIGARELRRTSSRETEGFTSATLRRALDKVYYSGVGALDQLTSQASNSLLREERRNAILSIVREMSEEQESSRTNTVSTETSSTVIVRAVGVDDKLAATHHRFKAIVPISAKVEMYDVGLTWAPRISNPFFALRQAIRDVYTRAYNDHLQRYYVPEPNRPAIVWERYIATTEFWMEGEEEVTERFSITLHASDREERPDFNNAQVIWDQDESIWNDDPDHFIAVLEDLGFSGGTITGRVHLETDDGGADFQGTARVEVPILRYSQETVNAQAQYELDLADTELRRDALAAQARQYAAVKQRDFIERHEQLNDLKQIVFADMIKSVCLRVSPNQHSYYKEIIARAIDWANAKIEFEQAALDNLTFTEFPPDHFTNSKGVRMFLPIFRSAETNLFDALEACGSLQIRQSVEEARNRVETERLRLERDGPDELDSFSSEMVIGEHIEAVMGEHDMAS